MSVKRRVIDNALVRFLKKGKAEASIPQPAEIIVTDTGKIDIFSHDFEFPTIHLNAANVCKPKHPQGDTTWISLNIIQNIEANFNYVNIQVKHPSAYDTLMIASGYFCDSISAETHVPLTTNKKKVVEPAAGKGSCARVRPASNRPAKRKFGKIDVIVIDDEDEPPVKKRAEKEPAPSPEVVELQGKLKLSEEKFQKLCDVARRDKEALQARVEHLETLIDSKEGIVTSANKASVEDELKKKVGELTKELEKERKRSTELQQKLEHVEAQLLQQPQPDASFPNLDTATVSLGSQSQEPSDAVIVPPVDQPQLQPNEIGPEIDIAAGLLGSPHQELSDAAVVPPVDQPQLQPTESGAILDIATGSPHQELTDAAVATPENQPQLQPNEFCANLDIATGLLGSQHQEPSDTAVTSLANQLRSTVVDFPQPPSDPRPYRVIERPEDLIVPILTLDDEYTGIPPKREVTITDLNDNVNKDLLLKMARKQKLEPEDVIIFYHPTTKKHLEMAHILFRSSKDARQFVDSNKDTRLMGCGISCRLDPYAAELSWMYANMTRGAKLPVLPYLSGLSEEKLSLKREELIKLIDKESLPWGWRWRW